MTVEPFVVPPIVASTVRAALGEREARGGLAGMTRTAALTAAELAAAPITTRAVVEVVADWHARHPLETAADGRSTMLAGIWGGRAGRDWAVAMLGAAPPSDERAGPVAAGMAVVAVDTGRVLLLQRALDDEDSASGRWEFPGGKIDEGEGAYEAAQREFAEEVGVPCPGRLSGDWTSPNGVYHAFVHTVDSENAVVCNSDHEDRAVLNPDDPDGDCIEVVAWWSIDDADGNSVLRDEVRDTTPWDELRAVANARVAALPRTSTCDYCEKRATKALLHAEGMAYVPVCDDHEAEGRDEIGSAELSGVRAFSAAISDPLPIVGRRNGGDVDHPAKPRLRRLSKKLGRIDRDLRSKLAAGAEVAMADALRRAGVKVAERAKRKSKATQAAALAAGGCFTPAVLAAVGLTEQEAMAYAFATYAEEAERWIVDAQRRRVDALRESLGWDAETAALAAKRYAQARDSALAALIAGMTELGYERLADPHPAVEALGETVSSAIPGGLVADVLAALDGKGVTVVAGEAPGRVDVVAEGITLGYIVADGVDAIEEITWVWGGSARPFDPHQRLDGTTATPATMHDVWGKDPTEWPTGNTMWRPYDHVGCSCSWESEFTFSDAVTSESAVA